MTEWQPILGETPIDPSGLVPRLCGVVRTRKQLDVEEAENIRRAIVKYLAGPPGTPSARKAPFDLNWILRLHREMLDRVWVYAGRVRTMELNMGVPPWNVQADLENMLRDLRAWEDSGMPLAEQAAHVHYRAVHIHPFEGGNGRWARLLANIWLKQHRARIVRWPEGGIGRTSPIRDEYMAALRAADQGDRDALIELHRRYSTP